MIDSLGSAAEARRKAEEKRKEAERLKKLIEEKQRSKMQSRSKAVSKAITSRTNDVGSKVNSTSQKDLSAQMTNKVLEALHRLEDNSKSKLESAQAKLPKPQEPSSVETGNGKVVQTKISLTTQNSTEPSNQMTVQEKVFSAFANYIRILAQLVNPLHVPKATTHEAHTSKCGTLKSFAMRKCH